MWKTAFKKFEAVWSAESKPHSFRFFKGCLPQILLGQFLNTLSHIILVACRGNISIKKHSFVDVLQNTCSRKFRNIYRKTPVLESLFNKVAGNKKGLRHRCFLVNIAKFSRTAFLYNTSGGYFF